MKKALFVIISFVILSFLISCETADDNLLEQAQKCLDVAKPDTAQDCIDGIEGVGGQKADVIRCTGVYIKQGFVGSILAQKMRDMQNKKEKSTPKFLVGLSFDDILIARENFEVCVRSGQISLMFFSAVTLLATSIGGTNTDDLLANLNSSQGTFEDMANATEKICTYCQQGSAKNANICKAFVSTCLQSNTIDQVAKLKTKLIEEIMEQQ